MSDSTLSSRRFTSRNAAARAVSTDTTRDAVVSETAMNKTVTSQEATCKETTGRESKQRLSSRRSETPLSAKTQNSRAQSSAGSIEHLVKQMQNIRKIAVERVTDEAIVAVFDQTLTDLTNSLRIGKPVLQIVSQDFTQAKELQTLLTTSEPLKDLYQIQTNALSDSEVQPSSPLPALVLHAADATVCYELSPFQTQTIGRHPTKAQILLPADLSLVGGCHAEIQLSPDGDWQIRDLDSRNGTYINSDEKLQDWYSLVADDRICLGSPYEATGSATLVFEHPFQPANCLTEAHKLLDCNVLCLIVNLGQPFAATAKRLIEQASQAPIAKVVLITTSSEVAPDIVQMHLGELETWMEQQSYRSLLEHIPLLLRPIAPIPKATVIMPNTRPEFETLCQVLETVVNHKSAEMTVQRASTQLLWLIEAIEQVLAHQATLLNQKIQRGNQKLNEFAQMNLKEQTKRAGKTVESEVDQFFRQVKAEVSQSRANLFHESREGSLSYKIQQFVARLGHTVTQKGESFHVQLHLDDDAENVHLAMLSFCQQELQRWAVTEWRRICFTYNQGGLRELFQTSYRTLNCVPNAELPIALFQPPQPIRTEPVLQISAVSPEWELRCKQTTFWSFLYKRIKSEVIALLSLIALFSTPIFGSVNKSHLILPLIPVVLLLLGYGYKQERSAKVEETVEKLQKSLIKYYEDISETLADQLVQYLSSSWETEKRRLEKTVATVNEGYVTHLADLERQQMQLKLQTEEYRKMLQKSKETVELQKLKQELSTRYLQLTHHK